MLIFGSKVTCNFCGAKERPKLVGKATYLIPIFYSALLFSFFAPQLLILVGLIGIWSLFTKSMVCANCGKKYLSFEEIRKTYTCMGDDSNIAINGPHIERNDKESRTSDEDGMISNSNIGKVGSNASFFKDPDIAELRKQFSVMTQDDFVELDPSNLTEIELVAYTKEKERRNINKFKDVEESPSVAEDLICKAKACHRGGDSLGASKLLKTIINKYPNSPERDKAELELDNIEKKLTKENEVEPTENSIGDFLLGEIFGILRTGIVFWLGLVFIGVNFRGASIDNAFASWPITLPAALVGAISLRYFNR